MTEALNLAQERQLDLIQVTEKIEPPVCKLGNYGKYLYWQEKKHKDAKTHRGGETKGIRLSFGISPHDLGIRANQAEKFLKEGNKIMIELVLRGREKALAHLAGEKINLFFEILNKKIPIKQESAPRRSFRGIITTISKA